jgi:hypothetical protein
MRSLENANESILTSKTKKYEAITSGLLSSPARSGQGVVDGLRYSFLNNGALYVNLSDK